MIYPLLIFIITYILLLIFNNHKVIISAGAVLIYLIFNFISVKDALYSIDFNIILMLIGIMGTVGLFIESNMPKLLASKLTQKITNTKLLVVCISSFAGIISAFVDNVATVIMVAPIALEICKKEKINGTATIISIAIFSNLEGAATLVGDTTSVLLAGKAGMNFLDFFIYNGKIGLFFIIQVSLILSLIVLSLLTKKKEIKGNTLKVKVLDYTPTIFLLMTIFSLIASSFITNKPSITNGLICTFFFILGIINKCIKEKKVTIIKNLIKIDFETILLLTNLFIIIEVIRKAGILEHFSGILTTISHNPFILYTIIVFASVLISAIIDNIPYTLTMLPVIEGISSHLGINPTLFYFGLIVGATLGGNLTPIGASANIAGMNILKKEGYQVNLKEYLKISLPITLTAVISGYLLVYLIYR